MAKIRSSVVLWCLLAFPLISLAGEPSWWTDQKRACGLSPSLAYNTWQAQGSPCPGQSRPSTPAYDYEAERRRNEEQERQRREEEDRQRQAEERRRQEEQRRQAEFVRQRDEAARTLRGSTGGIAPGAGELRGSTPALGELRGSRIETGIRELKPETLRGSTSGGTHGEPARSYVHSGNGLIGGMLWITGYNVPPGSDTRIRAKAKEMVKQQADLANIRYNEAIDFEKYNFVLGVAASTGMFQDLRKRVIFDELSAGQATPQMQNAYNSLKGRQFDRLECHSNGAMICLAALMNQDIRAKEIVLYGPQITPESLLLWQEIVRNNKQGVVSVQIAVNEGDKIPAAALLFGSLMGSDARDTTVHNLTTTLSRAPVLFSTRHLASVIREISPSIDVKTYPCTAPGLLGCHEMQVYKVNSGCASSGATVPGTRVHGRGVLEPPPC